MTGNRRWRLAAQRLSETLSRWHPSTTRDRGAVEEALMDLVVDPFGCGVEDPEHPGIFTCDVAGSIVVVFVPDTEPDPDGIYWIAVTDIFYG